MGRSDDQEGRNGQERALPAALRRMVDRRQHGQVARRLSPITALHHTWRLRSNTRRLMRRYRPLARN